MERIGPNPDELLSVRAFVRRYPELGSEAAWRWRIFCASQNGLLAAGGFVRNHRRLWLVVPRVVAWLAGSSADAA